MLVASLLGDSHSWKTLGISTVLTIATARPAWLMELGPVPPWRMRPMGAGYGWYAWGVYISPSSLLGGTKNIYSNIKTLSCIWIYYKLHSILNFIKHHITLHHAVHVRKNGMMIYQCQAVQKWDPKGDCLRAIKTRSEAKLMTGIHPELCKPEDVQGFIIIFSINMSCMYINTVFVITDETAINWMSIPSSTVESPCLVWSN